MVKTMCGEEEAQKPKTIPLSDNSEKKGTIATDQESTLTERLRNSLAYALQMDVSTERKNSHALTFVRYMQENAIHDSSST